MSAGLCLGIDPHAALLAEWGTTLEDFGARAVEAAAGVVDWVKPQAAFYEAHGARGFAALESTIERARAAGLRVIVDAKRGDIGSTMQGYADAWLRDGLWLTVNPYLGVGALAPAIDAALRHGGGLFVLCATSNPEGARIQQAVTATGRTVAAEVLDEVQARGSGSGRLGVVIGATVDLAAYGLDLAAAPDAPILAPGFGAQGARLAELRRVFGPAADRVVANVSREALVAGRAGLRARLVELRDEALRGLSA
ncbi:MAG: orotidine 5'-phosphate decarboxylase [Micrococcales bacterium 73-13]|nr:MAG: orotidine 5'-phosphate decarboxylase [Micrococcales bacterium 73-13]